MKSERSIWDVVKDIGDGRFLLPNIQRPFVWEKDQVRDLIDSILRGYPIGALMIWKPNVPGGPSIRCRRFLSQVVSDPDLRANLLYNSSDGAYLVLDGQQRLQSLYLAFFGTWEGDQLYLNVARTLEKESDDRLYDIDFFRSTNPPAASSGYYPLVKLMELTDPRSRRLFGRDLLQVMNREGDDDLEDTIGDIVGQVQAKFISEPRLLFQEIDERLGYSEVLEVFKRVNSGGTKLEASDLAFAIVKLEQGDLEEKMYSLLDILKQSGFQSFDTDFLIKAALLILGRGAKYDLSRINDSFLADFAAHFDSIQRAMDNTIEFLVNHCKIQADRFLRSPNALIPILDYLMRQRGQDFPPGAQDQARTYLYMSQFFRLFGRGTDTVLNRLHEVMPGKVVITPTTTESFPLPAIADYMTKRQARPFAYDPAMLEDLDIVLNIIHGGVKQLPVLRGWSLERDHIFPRRLLENMGLPDDMVNDIGNFRFLTKARNIRKSDGIPEATEFFGGNDSVVRHYFEQARTSLTRASYEDFVKARRSLIEQQLRGFIGI